MQRESDSNLPCQDGACIENHPGEKTILKFLLVNDHRLMGKYYAATICTRNLDFKPKTYQQASQ
jgi:hypothetical protein